MSTIAFVDKTFYNISLIVGTYMFSLKTDETNNSSPTDTSHFPRAQLNNRGTNISFPRWKTWMTFWTQRTSTTQHLTQFCTTRLDRQRRVLVDHEVILQPFSVITDTCVFKRDCDIVLAAGRLLATAAIGLYLLQGQH